jgi:hypothetical protein
MRALNAIGGSIKNFMILFSFIVNLILVIVLIVLGLLIFEIKNQVATPLISGLHSSFVGLDEATIDWTIPVRAQVPVRLDVPVALDTTVVLTQTVPLTVSANITLPGVGELNNATVNLSLPAGLQLPVALNFTLPLDQQLPVNLDVRAVIPLNQTQLHDPFENLRLMFEPLAVALHNLPDGFNEVPGFVGDVLDSDGVNLLAPNAYSVDPWTGFSRTAGIGYSLGGEAVPPANVAFETGLVPLGGIPLLDQLVRPGVWDAGGPQQINAQAGATLTQQGVPNWSYNGDGVPVATPLPEVQPVTEESASPSG